MPRKSARDTVLDDRAIADIALSVTAKQREQIIDKLLSGVPHEDIVAGLMVTSAQVLDVADSIKQQLQEAERKRVNELRSLLLNGTVKAFKKLITRLDDPDFPDKMLPSTAGVLFDKWSTMMGSTNMSQMLLVNGTGNIGDVMNNAMAVMSRISSRIGDAEQAPIPYDEGDDEE